MSSDRRDQALVTPPKSGDLLLGRYLLREIISSGGMGLVFAADDQRLGRGVAIKFADLASNQPTAAVSFLAEAESTGQLDHPNIIPIYDIRHSPHGAAFTIMRRVHGETLKELIARRNDPGQPVSTNQLVQVLVSICQAVRYAHSRGVLHRDIKPANVMVGRFGEVMLLDWGLSSLIGGAHTDPKLCRLAAEFEVVGTPAYLAPEQARYELEDERTDVHGLGGILFEILSGTPPYLRSNIAETIKMSRTGQTNPLPEDGPPALVAICRKAIQPDPNDRYPAATPLREDLTAYLEGEPVSVYPDSLPVRISRWVTRHPMLLGMLLSTTIILALLTGVLAIQADRRATTLTVKRESAARNIQRLFISGMAARTAGRTLQSGDQPDPSQARLALINAASRFREVLRISPNNPRAQALLAETYLDLARLAGRHGSRGEMGAWLQECRRYDTRGALRKQLKALQQKH